MQVSFVYVLVSFAVWGSSCVCKSFVGFLCVTDWAVVVWALSGVYVRVSGDE